MTSITESIHDPLAFLHQTKRLHRARVTSGQKILFYFQTLFKSKNVKFLSSFMIFLPLLVYPLNGNERKYLLRINGFTLPWCIIWNPGLKDYNKYRILNQWSVWFLFVTVFGCLNITRINQFQQSCFSVSRTHSFFFSKLFQNVPGVTCEFPAGVLSDALGKKKMKRGKVLSLQISFRVNLGLFSFDLLGLKVGYFNMTTNRNRHNAATFIAVYKWIFFYFKQETLEKCSQGGFAQVYHRQKYER